MLGLQPLCWDANSQMRTAGQHQHWLAVEDLIKLSGSWLYEMASGLLRALEAEDAVARSGEARASVRAGQDGKLGPCRSGFGVSAPVYVIANKER